MTVTANGTATGNVTVTGTATETATADARDLPTIADIAGARGMRTRIRPVEATAIESEKTATLGVTAEETANGTAIVAPLAATHDAMTTKDPRDETEIHLTTAGEAGDVNPDGMMVDSVDKSLGAA